jgi:hypothetical protein
VLYIDTLPAIGRAVSVRPEAVVLLFKCRRRRLALEQPHPPPEGEAGQAPSRFTGPSASLVTTAADF